MSAPKPVPTNLKPYEVIYDHRGGCDPRYWCLPPFRGDPTRVPPLAHNGARYHLVWQGHTVGTFDTWQVHINFYRNREVLTHAFRSAAKTSLTGYPGSSNKGFSTIEECIDAWQALCPLGVHLHPPQPSMVVSTRGGTSAGVNTSRHPPLPQMSASHKKSVPKQESGGSKREEESRILADL
jgi:hypothetical protein